MSKTGFRSLPRKVTDTTRILQRLDGAVRNDAVSPKVAVVPMGRLLTLTGRQQRAPAV
jgi:hypothetical protein